MTGRVAPPQSTLASSRAFYDLHFVAPEQINPLLVRIAETLIDEGKALQPESRDEFRRNLQRIFQVEELSGEFQKNEQLQALFREFGIRPVLR